MRRRTLLTGPLLATPLLAAPPLAATAATVTADPAARGTVAPQRGPLTNTAHLTFLTTTVRPPRQAGHTTYRADSEPAVTMLWTYADRDDDGTYRRVGGGPLDEATGTWGQGAFNADDVARAAVVYVRHWTLTGDRASRRLARGLLRGLAYLQTAEGDDAGNVVLWMQPDGTLNPSAEPVELPDPSDSGPSYWLARTLWALGEGYAAFRDAEPGFARFLAERLDLGLAALERQVLDRYGVQQTADGVRVPAWLVVDGADASAEAVLGLTAFASAAAAGDVRTRADRAAARLARGIAQMSAGDRRTWPFGAVLPWTHSRSLWHAWASYMPAALAAAAGRGVEGVLPAAVRDAVTFTPLLLTTTGPVNGWLPAPGDLVQIAYGVDSRVQSLLAVGEAAGRPGLEDLAGLAAGWYFGANRAGRAMYDPATGVTFDGLQPDGTVNLNSGAESTIHGLLSMLALDARPRARAVATGATRLLGITAPTVVEGEAATGLARARVVTPEAAWTGESQWGGGAYLSVAAGGSATWSVPAHDSPVAVLPVLDHRPVDPAPEGVWRSASTPLGRTVARCGPRGVSEAAGALLPATLAADLPPGAVEVTLEVPGGAQPALRVDSLLLLPVVTTLALDGGVLVRNGSGARRTARVAVPWGGPATVTTYDASGRRVSRFRTAVTAEGVSADCLPGGFTTVLP